MEKPKYMTRYDEAADSLDLSYVELQEHDFLDSQAQEFACGFKEGDECLS